MGTESYAWLASCVVIRPHPPILERVEIDVCVDCLFILETGETNQPGFDYVMWSNAVDDRWPDRDGWTIFVDSADSFFSWRPCESCGSPLGGDRYNAVAIRR